MISEIQKDFKEKNDKIAEKTYKRKCKLYFKLEIWINGSTEVFYFLIELENKHVYYFLKQ